MLLMYCMLVVVVVVQEYQFDVEVEVATKLLDKDKEDGPIQPSD